MATPGATVWMAVMMFTPTAAAIIVGRLWQRRSWRSLWADVGVWPVRSWRRVLSFAAGGLVGIVLVVAAGVGLAVVLGQLEPDLQSFSGFAAQLRSVTGETDLGISVRMLVLLQLVSIPLGAVFNTFVAVGEEIGWRGWLLAELQPIGRWPAAALTGALWGLWHSPVILLGYNFARPNALGVGVMIIGCVLVGMLLAWVRSASDSIWPAAVAHGALNASAGMASLVVAAGTNPDPVAVSPLGWVTWIVLGAFVSALVLTTRGMRRGGGNRFPASSS
ncbi:CPBP family intramembrane metalloprotease (plasmid) [Curtobacterium sp. TC1]|uniref:CPBP family intramembrane glutamic endopeptidase n=1 Tax=Curtobacterium sp. TC1 TaxID=2862880 RepID=UPI001C9B07B7|nr:CPBP family intramembrane glutamic endopeptidase [Curtobacterium sp. TC1]QZQ53603.1 CPBP family intramembrane metalloprotease [Curtobacterium sp. TC1]